MSSSAFSPMTAGAGAAPLLPAFLPPVALPLPAAHTAAAARSPLLRRAVRATHDAPSTPPTPAPRPRRLQRLLLSVAAAALVPIGGAHAARDKSVITMTDQVPNFTLPSQEQAVAPGGESRFAPVLRVASFAVRRVVPPVALLALAVWGARVAMRRAQERQLRDFQTQLSSFSSMLDLDKPVADAPQKDAATRAREMVDGSKTRFRFREDTSKQDDADLAAKMQLDLFTAGEKAAGDKTEPAVTDPAASAADPVAAAAAAADAPAKTADATAMPVTPTEIADAGVDIAAAEPANPLEQAVADALGDARAGRAGGAAARVAAAQAASGLSPGEATAAVTAFLSRAVSAAIDGAAGQLNESEEAAVLSALQDLGQWMGAARTIAPDARLRYGGRHAGDETMVEEVYRRYALFCLSGAPGDAAAGAAAGAAPAAGGPVSAQGLADMQVILGLGDARAETINTEIAKGMFQVAVSAAVADGSLSDEDKQALENVKESFGSYLDGSSADSIVSEVAVMRAMYSLQQLLQEQGVSADDVKELRKMCKELGVDIDEMLQNADAMGDALGPEAKQFVDSLRGLLASTDASVDNGDADAKGGDAGGAALGAA